MIDSRTKIGAEVQNLGNYSESLPFCLWAAQTGTGGQRDSPLAEQQQRPTISLTLLSFKFFADRSKPWENVTSQLSAATADLRSFSRVDLWLEMPGYLWKTVVLECGLHFVSGGRLRGADFDLGARSLSSRAESGLGLLPEYSHSRTYFWGPEKRWILLLLTCF